MTDIDYFLFPHTTLSSTRLQKLCLFLPRLEILEIVSRAPVPEGTKEKVSGYAVLGEGELSSRIDACIRGYRDFAKVHGGPGGILGFLRQALDEIDEPRYRIQEELRGKFPPDAEQKEIVRAAIFLEMARELDEKELELAEGYDRLGAIEREFRDILGIEEEDAEPVETSLEAALAPDENSLLYMLPKRIEAWLRIFSLRRSENAPVFVAGFPEVVEESLESIRTACEKSGKAFSTTALMLGPVPWLPEALPEGPETLELLSSCRQGLGDFLKSAARGAEPQKLEEMRASLQSCFERLCNRCGASQNVTAALRLTVVEKLPLAALPGLPPLSLAGEAADWPPVFLSVEFDGIRA
ncbi:MAG: hypothetical protein ACP5SH_01105 [Syntrophobacteraceae bacterium]